MIRFHFRLLGFLLLILVCAISLPYAQDIYDDDEVPFDSESVTEQEEEFPDESGGDLQPDDDAGRTDPVFDPLGGPGDIPGDYDASTTVSSPSITSGEHMSQNAIIEGVQLTAEPGTNPDEKIIAGYFIFRDKPSSYFYEIKPRDKKLIFEFNDTKVGSSPVPTASEPPIKGFIIEQGKIDVNKAVKGLKPEWHDLIRVVFDLEAVPDVHVNDEYSIISFSFKWTSDPEKQAKYIVKDKTPKVILWSTAGVGGIALGAVAYFLLRNPETGPELEPLDISDLPLHSTGF